MEVFLIRLLQFVLAISLLVLLHEGGHMFFSKLFGVKVEKVNTINVRGRWRRQGMHAGYTAKSKKAIVTLKKDSKGIEFFEGMATEG